VEYLLLAAIVMVAGVSFVVWRNRRPSGIDASISEFEQSLEAIAPPGEEQRGRRSG
jgi:hypothetical protein